MNSQRYLSAKEAARVLKVSPATLYAYVSRGIIRSEVGEGNSRARRYHAEDVQKLVERKAQRKNPAEVARTALHWGTPILESALTLITDGGLYYRGQDVGQLATTRTFEEVAALLWGVPMGEATRLFAGKPMSVSRVAEGLQPLHRLQVALMLASERDLAAYRLEAEQVRRSGGRILQLMTQVLANASARHSEGGPMETTIAQTLARAWRPKDAQAASLINAALILSADHELNVSSFTARVVASAKGQPYQVVVAGLAALQGLRHGGITEQVEGLLREIGKPRNSHKVLAERLRRGELIPGFGHVLYPEGDPRGRLLLGLLQAAYPRSAELALAKAVVVEVEALLGLAPTIDFVLAVLARVLGLPEGSALALFALGRTVGWIGHALEQYGQEALIRPRASYVGEKPSVA